MGNVELCGGPTAQTSTEIVVLGHMKNAQTRALMSILDAAHIKYTFQVTEVPSPSKNVNNNVQGTQGQDKTKDQTFLKQKAIPMIIHNGYKILSDMTKFVYYIHENFKGEMLASGVWPKGREEDIVFLLEWYSTKLRPFMWEFYGIMMSAS